MDPIMVGFKYLGYNLKPLGYSIKDWKWILKEIEKRISHWYFRLLSLGGKLILIREVLIGLPVYWFTLAPVPKSIFNRLRQLIFAFLLGNSSDNHRMQLAISWQSLSRPKEFGG